MSITTGTRLGSYEVVAQIGAGGMGEVYQAHDTKLGRDVAIKVLPEAFAHDAERLSRFQREAKMLAALNHPNIATIYGLEQSGGISYLVMELVPGATLAERVKREGPVPVEEALKIGVQIAEALEAAHEKSIIHRDLKPANVKLTPEGKVKVLDFGLAKAFEGDPSSVDMSNSPTLSMAATMQGVILGTAAYMSPEQARGKSVDKRTDIWAFGCVLYELLTAKQAFHGEDITDILAAVVRAEPDWQALPAATPQRIRSLLRRCLQKDRRQRMHDAGDVRIEIEEALAAPPDAERTAVALPARGWRERLGWPAATGVLAIIAVSFAVGFMLRTPKPAQPKQTMRLTADIGADATLYTALGPGAVLSPDGTRVAFLASPADQKRRIYTRTLDQAQSVALSGTEDASYHFFSPDGQWIGFFADGKLKKISVQGGAAITLCDALNGRGGSWGDDGTIVFTPDILGGLSRVSSAGGAPEPLTKLDLQSGEVTHHWPQILPGSKTVLFSASNNTFDYDNADIVAYTIATGQRKTVLHGGFYARYLPGGYMVYVNEGSLFAVPFDLQRLETTGQPVPILEGVLTGAGSQGAQFAFSDNGELVYVAGHGTIQAESIDWMDREGKLTPLRETPGNYFNPAFSPDGKRLALEINDGKRNDIWVYEMERDTLTRLTFGGETNRVPIWTPDGKRIVYSSQEKVGALNLWWIRSDGGGDAQRLTGGNARQLPDSWSPDGKTLLFDQVNPGGNTAVMTLPMESDGKSGWKAGTPAVFVKSGYNYEAAFSPDGRWLAYSSNDSGSFEIFVRPFPGPGGKWQISTGGGTFPKWSRDGKELFYRSPENKIMAVTYTASGDSFRADKPQLWSPGQLTNVGAGISSFDLHPDGKRFAVLRVADTGQATTASKVSFILNFSDEIRGKFQAGK